jgi:hypothetical protein
VSLASNHVTRSQSCHRFTGLDLKGSLSFSKSTRKPVMMSKSADGRPTSRSSTVPVDRITNIITLLCIYIYFSLPNPTAALKPHGVLATRHFVSILAALSRHVHCDLPQLREARPLQQGVSRELEKPTLVRLSIPAWTRWSRRRSPAIGKSLHYSLKLTLVLTYLVLARLGLDLSYIIHDIQRMSEHQLRSLSKSGPDRLVGYHQQLVSLRPSH